MCVLVQKNSSFSLDLSDDGEQLGDVTWYGIAHEVAEFVTQVVCSLVGPELQVDGVDHVVASEQRDQLHLGSIICSLLGSDDEQCILLVGAQLDVQHGVLLVALRDKEAFKD